MYCHTLEYKLENKINYPKFLSDIILYYVTWKSIEMLSLSFKFSHTMVLIAMFLINVIMMMTVTQGMNKNKVETSEYYIVIFFGKFATLIQNWMP